MADQFGQKCRARGGVIVDRGKLDKGELRRRVTIIVRNVRIVIGRQLGADGGERIIRAVGGPACIAKNRYGLPAELPLSWNALVAAMTAPAATSNEGAPANG